MSEKEKILKMVAEGQISVDEGEKLLKAINAVKKKNVAPVAPAEAPTAPEVITPVEEVKVNKKMKGKLVIDIDSASGDKVKVNLPLRLASLAANMIPKEKLADIQSEGIDISGILNNITELIDEVDDDIVNVESASGDKVRIYIVK